MVSAEEADNLRKERDGKRSKMKHPLSYKQPLLSFHLKNKRQETLFIISSLLFFFGSVLPQFRTLINYSWASSVIHLAMSFKKSFVSSLILLVYPKEINRPPNHDL